MKTALVMRRGSVVGKDIYVGIDVHKESWQITVRTEGEEIFNGRIPGQCQSLKKFFERYQGSPGSTLSPPRHHSVIGSFLALRGWLFPGLNLLYTPARVRSWKRMGFFGSSTFTNLNGQWSTPGFT